MKAENDAGSNLAVNAEALAISSGLPLEDAARALQAAAKKLAEQADFDRRRLEGTLRGQIFRPDGTLKGVTYGKASLPRRGAILRASLKGHDGKKVNTSFLVDGKDFHEAYEMLVAQVVDFFRIPPGDEINNEIRASKEAFLRANRMSTKRIVIEYDQLVSLDDFVLSPDGDSAT